jgi:hypothetical protein
VNHAYVLCVRFEHVADPQRWYAAVLRWNKVFEQHEVFFTALLPCSTFYNTTLHLRR